MCQPRSSAMKSTTFVSIPVLFGARCKEHSRYKCGPRAHAGNGTSGNGIPSKRFRASPTNRELAHQWELDDDCYENEFFFDGLSYPPEVLEWCTTTKEVDDLEEENSMRLCVDEAALQTRVDEAFVETFRMSSPYINAHHGLIFVIHIPGALVEEELFSSVMKDIALMRVIGIKLVLVLGPRLQIEKRLKAENIKTQFIDGVRVTDARTLQIIKEAAGSMRFEVEGVLARGVVNMPSDSRVSVVSGSFFSAKPLGIIDGKDFGFTGKVRKIDVEGIERRLNQGDIIVIPNVGFSPSGQQFNCQSESVAAACAAQLKAEKLIFMASGESIFDNRSNRTIPNLTLKSALRFMKNRAYELPTHFRTAVEEGIGALQKGVRRIHILNRFINGVLLMEVFHRDGVGLMISRDLYEGIRRATLSDVMGMLEIIKPLEESGILKKRDRATIEREIDDYVVIERDGMIIACLSLCVMKDDPSWAELGCLAVHTKYRKLGKGDAMLGFTERMAYSKGVRNLFILSTQSFHFFLERGFSEVHVKDLPKSRQQYYDFDRKAKIFYKLLEGSRAVDEAEVLKHL